MGPVKRKQVFPFLLGLCLLFSVPACGREVPSGISWTAGTCAQGSLMKREGVWVLRLAGTPEEMGQQAGTLLKPQVRALIGSYVPRMQKASGRTREDLLQEAHRLETGIPPTYVAELKALARAAEVPYEDLLIANLSVELFGSSLCSCAVASPEASSQHETLFGRNLDWYDDGLLASHGILIAVFPKDAKPFVSLSYPGLIGVVTGVNADGLAVANMTVSSLQTIIRTGPPETPDPPVTPYLFLQRRILEICHDRSEAQWVIEGQKRTINQNIMLADRKGGSLLEVSSLGVRSRPVQDGIAVASNSFHEDDVADKGGERYRSLCGACVQKPVTPDMLMKGLKAAAIPSMNVQCCLFRLGSMKATLSYGTLPASKGPFVEVDLAVLLKP